MEGNPRGPRGSALAHLGRSLPVRVARRLLDTNGLLLSAGVSYQALFATFAAMYVVLVTVGSWFVAEDSRLTPLIDTVNTTVPGLIGDDGAITREQLISLTQHNFAELGFSGFVALVVLVWTASAWITNSRLAIRSVMGLPADSTPYLHAKTRDLITSVAFGALLLAGAAVSTLSTKLFTLVTTTLGIPAAASLAGLAAQALGLGVVFALDATVLAVMFRRLSGADLGVRQVVLPVAIGGVTLTALQVLGSTLIIGGPGNPLLATFVVFITLLLWFRLTALVTLASAAWIAEAASDRGTPLTARPRRRETRNAAR